MRENLRVVVKSSHGVLVDNKISEFPILLQGATKDIYKLQAELTKSRGGQPFFYFADYQGKRLNLESLNLTCTVLSERGGFWSSAAADYITDVCKFLNSPGFGGYALIVFIPDINELLDESVYNTCDELLKELGLIWGDRVLIVAGTQSAYEPKRMPIDSNNYLWGHRNDEGIPVANTAQGIAEELMNPSDSY